MKQSGMISGGSSDIIHPQTLHRLSQVDSQSLSRGHSSTSENHVDSHGKAVSRTSVRGDNHTPGHVLDQAREVVVHVLRGAAERLEEIAMHIDIDEAMETAQAASPAPAVNAVTSITNTSTPTRLAFQTQARPVEEFHHDRIVELNHDETKDMVEEIDFEKEKDRLEKEKDKIKSPANAEQDGGELAHGGVAKIMVPGAVEQEKDVLEEAPHHHQFHLREVVIDHLRREEASNHADREHEQQRDNGQGNHFYYFIAGGVLVLSSVIVGVVLGIEGGDIW